MSTEWYEQLADAMRRREKAKLYLAKWEDELHSAEADIRILTEQKLEEPVDPTTFQVEYTQAPGNYPAQGA